MASPGSSGVKVSSTGVSVQLSTFLRWPTGGYIGYKTEIDCGRESVVEIWCKTCTKHCHKIESSLRGHAVNGIRRYVTGTRFVTKHTVLRHLQSKAQAAGQNFESLKGKQGKFCFFQDNLFLQA